MNDPILVLGKDGLVGRAVCARLGARAEGLSHGDCDFLNVAFLDTVDAAYTARPFSAVINAAAYTRVDDAEAEDSGNLLRVNAVAPGELAHWCQLHGVALVHFSTDYVFDGSGTRPWREDDTPNPLNAYGMSKLAGERAVQAAGGRTLLFRTSWVYAPHGRNFFTSLRLLLRERETIAVVDDQVGAPTYAGDLAAAVLSALETALEMPQFPSGLYHLCHGGEVSRYGFAQRILAAEQAAGAPLACREIMPVASAHYAAKAARPANSRLDCRLAASVLGARLPGWEDGLKACFAAAG